VIAEKAAVPLRIGDVTVIPLVRVRLQGGRDGRGVWVRGSAGPAGLVVLSGKGAEFLDEEWKAAAAEDCLERFEGLAELIEAHRGAAGRR